MAIAVQAYSDESHAPAADFWKKQSFKNSYVSAAYTGSRIELKNADCGRQVSVRRSGRDNLHEGWKYLHYHSPTFSVS